MTTSFKKLISQQPTFATLVLFFSFFFPVWANAACTVSAGGVISANCTDAVINWSNSYQNFTINTGVNVNGQVEATFSSLATHNFINNGTMSIVGGTAIYSLVPLTIDSFTNNWVLGTATGTSNALQNGASITELTNNGWMIGGGVGLPAIYNIGAIGTFTNNQVISADIGIRNDGIIGDLTHPTTTGIYNTVAGTITGSTYGILNNGGTVTSIINSGSITSGTSNPEFAIRNDGTIGSIENSGTIHGYIGIANYGGGTINSIRNTGSIIGPDFDIVNYGTIATLSNSQGVGNVNGPLTLYQNLPNTYKIIVNNPSSYGQLTVTGIGSGHNNPTTFGIDSSSTLSKRTYNSVLSGLGATYLNNTSGIFNGFNWSLIETDITNGIWDLSITGASTVDTQSSVHNSAQRMRSIFNTAAISTNFANMNTYDCNLFDTKGMCISAGGRYTTVDNPSANSSSAVVVVGYKATPNIRIGGFLDQNFNTTTPTGIHIANKNPMMGAFAVWNQNEDHLGYQVKIANAYQDKDVTTTRDVIGTSEAGRGKTELNTQSYVGELSYAFTFKDNTLVRPYLALRHTTIKQDAYTEDTTALVTAPLTYAALEDKSTAALLGIKLNHALTPKANLTASLGIEQDLSHKVDQYAASGVSGLTSENFNDNIKHTRPVASLGAYYALTKTQRISGDVYYQQLPFQSTGSTTAYFNYMIGL